MIGNVIIFVHNGKAATTSIVDGTSIALDGHADNQTSQNQTRDHRRSAIADEGHRLSRHRNDVQDTCSVDKELERKHKGRALRDHSPLEVGRLATNLKCHVDKQREDCQKQHRPHKAELLADNREDVIVMGLGQIAVFHRGVTDATSE